MFGNLGVGEIMLIAAVALILLGPEKFPEYAKIALRAYKDLRGYVDDIKREMREELRPVQREIQNLNRYEPEKYIDKLASAVSEGLDDSPKAADGGSEGTATENAADTAGTESPTADSSPTPVADENASSDSSPATTSEPERDEKYPD
jgi:Tat protein translocase TatB subunit